MSPTASCVACIVYVSTASASCDASIIYVSNCIIRHLCLQQHHALDLCLRFYHPSFMSPTVSSICMHVSSSIMQMSWVHQSVTLCLQLYHPYACMSPTVSCIFQQYHARGQGRFVSQVCVSQACHTQVCVSQACHTHEWRAARAHSISFAPVRNCSLTPTRNFTHAHVYVCV